MRILLTGGLGFIGSHCATDLLMLDNEIIIIDNLANSRLIVLDKIKQITGKEPKFYQIDMLDLPLLDDLFKNEHIDLVIHLAGLKSVNESVKQPLHYYHHNIMVTINLLSVMQKYNVKKLIFSSSATCYGNNQAPFNESMITGIGPMTPYAKTKYIIEEMLKDVYNQDTCYSIVILRYFNPCGSHESHLIGENPNNIPNNLMPILVNCANTDSVFNICGSDYNTPDGTCLRDFIHIVDLAQGHNVVIQKLEEPGLYIYNLGTGRPYSVKDIVLTFQKVNQIDLKYKYAERRDGDIDVSYANVDKIGDEFGWSAKKTLEDICRDAWLAHQTYHYKTCE